MPDMTRLSGRNSEKRRGSALYIAVLSTALIVSLLGLAGLTIVRIERRQVSTTNDILVARMNAHSAVELALHRIADDPDWRTTYTHGVETTTESLGANATGTLSWILEDSDGSLTDADTNLRLKGIGRVGSTVQVSSVAVTISSEALDCLEVAACSGSAMDFESGSTITTNQTISSNWSVTTGINTTVNGNVEAVEGISGTGYNGTTTSPVPARTLPDASVFDYYLSNGTQMLATDLPKVGPNHSISDAVLSPNSNPYGPVNAQGIYVIDCQGIVIGVKYSRIIGTLVLINPHPASDIILENSFEPAVPNYPALLVYGSIEFRMENTVLDEAARGVNFNPSGSPYEGSADTDQVDTYPSQIKGLVYVSDFAHFADGDTQIVDGMLVVGGQISVNSSDGFSVTYNSLFHSNPPPGFSDGERMVPVPGSWIRDAAP
jgi:Tfp pilus assembly protein PilX